MGFFVVEPGEAGKGHDGHGTTEERRVAGEKASLGVDVVLLCLGAIDKPPGILFVIMGMSVLLTHFKVQRPATLFFNWFL